MVGLNFSTWIRSEPIVPQAWSLGVECQFYLLFPILFVRRRIAFLASFAFFVLTYFGRLSASVWAYRMIFGALFMFLFGSLIRRSDDRLLLPLSYALICIMFITVCMHREFQNNLRFEILVGLVFGVPVVYTLSKMRLGKFDHFLGNLSYGVFLNHFFLM
jgi:peptidoglycan/LPS O-acetylase OafA/YrhL